LQFLSKSRKQTFQKTLWKKYVWKRQTTEQLAEHYQKSVKWNFLSFERYA